VAAQKLSGSQPASKAKPLKKASEKKTAPSQDYTQFKAILLEKRRRLYGDVAMMSEEALGSEEASVDNHAPIHPAEVGSHSFEQEFTLGLLSRDGDKIRLVDLALEKMAEGSYGLCDECGCRIPKGRLEMLPEAIYCVKCASKLEGPGF
jgi:DnaK suppressor protein